LAAADRGCDVDRGRLFPDLPGCRMDLCSITPWIYWIPGLILALIIYQFGFSNLAKKNSRRIQNIPVEKPCIFDFQEWHSYPLVLFMIGLGITLRNFSPIPKPLLGIMYIGIGGGLGLSSLVYYLALWKHPGGE